MPNILLDPVVKENIILDIVAMFMNHDIDETEAQEISAKAIETLKVARAGLVSGKIDPLFQYIIDSHFPSQKKEVINV